MSRVKLLVGDSSEFRGVPHWHYHEDYCFRVARDRANEDRETAGWRRWFWSISVRKGFDYRSEYFESATAAIANAHAWIEQLRGGQRD